MYSFGYLENRSIAHIYAMQRFGLGRLTTGELYRGSQNFKRPSGCSALLQRSIAARSAENERAL